MTVFKATQAAELLAAAFVTTGTATTPTLVMAGTEAVALFQGLGEVCVSFSR